MRTARPLDLDQIDLCIQDTLRIAHENPSSFINIFSINMKKDAAFLEVLSNAISQDIRSIVYNHFSTESITKIGRCQSNEDFFRTVDFHWLESEIQTLQNQLTIAQEALADRTRTRNQIRNLTYHELHKYIMTKSPEWQFAEYMLRLMEKQGRGKGVAPNQATTDIGTVPFDPEGTSGDYWRERGE